MRYVIVAILVLICVASVTAQPSGRLDSLRYRAFASMNLPTSGTALMTAGIGNRVVNQSIGTVCNDFPAIEKYDTLVWTIAAEGATLPTDFLQIEDVWRMYGDSIRVKIYPESLYTKGPGDTTGSKQNLSDASSPAYYSISSWTIAPFPKYMKPTGYVDTILIKYRACDAWLTSDTLATKIAPNYMDALDWLVLANLYAIRSMYGDAAYWQGKYNSLRPGRMVVNK